MDSVKTAAEQAYNTIVAEFAAPYFFEKLAAHGYAPRNDQEAADMFAAAQKLHVLYTAEQEKAAYARTSNLAAINADLDEKLASAGLGAAAASAPAADVFYEAADVAAAEPKIASAVLTLQAAAAAALQNAE